MVYFSFTWLMIALVVVCPILKLAIEVWRCRQRRHNSFEKTFETLVQSHQAELDPKSAYKVAMALQSRY